MFKANTTHLQGELFSFENDLSSQQQKDKSYLEAHFFYERFFCTIDESHFSGLYSGKFSRPNAPINSMVSSLILKEKNNWTFADLFRELSFNILTKHSLGLTDLSTLPFSYKTLFNFLQRLDTHHSDCGENLLETVFNKFSLSEIKKLNLHTDIQRTDSTLVNSNIKKIGRLQLLIEIIKNLSTILGLEDKLYFSEELKKYTSQDSKDYIYELSSQDLPHEINKIAELYYRLNLHLKAKDEDCYSEVKEFKIFERAYREHIKVEDDKVTVIPAKELSSSNLQSPYDEDATYRHKNNEHSQGYKINGVETANPENPINLLTDVSVDKNNIDDSKILEQRLEGVKEKTPDINELHTDGGYSSSENDEVMDELNIDQIQTAVRGRKAQVEVVIDKDDDDVFTVKCPSQQVKSEPTKKRNKAVFEKTVCEGCPLKSKCKIHKAKDVFYFESKDHIANKRKRNIEKLPDDRKQCRNNVEATMHEFKCKLNHKGKLKTRGLFRAMIFAFSTAIAINFGRIFRYEIINPLDVEKIALNLFYFWVKFFNKWNNSDDFLKNAELCVF